MLSLRHKTNDHFWLSFFHGAGHLVLHGKRLRFIGMEGALGDGHEEEVNVFARDWLVPPQAARALLDLPKITEAAIRKCADKLDIAPGVVVGRLQKEGRLRWDSVLNKSLKVGYEWR